MNEEFNLILKDLKMYADLLLGCGNSGEEIKPETLSNVALKLFEISDQLEKLKK